MPFGRKKPDELMEIVGKIQSFEILSAFKYIDNLGVPSKRKSDTCYFIYNKKIYPIKLVTECINNDIKKNSQKINREDHDSWMDAWLYNDEVLPNNTELITFYNSSGRELVQNFRQKLLDNFKTLEVQDVNNNYTKIVKCNKNIAEIHFLQKRKNQFKVVVNCDVLPQYMVKEKASINSFGKVPDSHKWTLNGEYFVTTNPKTIDFAINALNCINDSNICEDDLCKLNNYDNVLKENFMSNIPLNQILYGPPGTGKTYNTVIKAMEIIDKDCIKYDKDGNVINYSEVKNKFDKYKESGQIKFITFHQSYSYEEFVEGIKPRLDDESLGFEQSDGIFKRICERASKKTIDNFDEVYDRFINDLLEYNEDNVFKLKTAQGKTFGVTVNSKKSLSLYTGVTLTKQGSLTKENLKNLSDWKYYANPIYEYLKTNYNLSVQSVNNSAQPYVLIIDEINRGNISKIFGELITLIEEDKRKKVVEDGKDYHTIKVTLPYTKTSFAVPNNLYIIGTMNTADKSLALLDIALRRRFEFVPMYPKYDIENLNYAEFLKELNEKIYDEKKSADYLIGHSYFIGDIDFAKVMNNKVIPLLMEYFNAKKEKVETIIKPLLEKEGYCIDKGEPYLLKVKAND